MIKRLAIIPARDGSKGLVGKNIKEINGKPLICHTIEQAINSEIFDTILISSDGEKIINIAKTYKTVSVVKRPIELASDQSDMLSVVNHAIKFIEQKSRISYDTITLLQPTSPLRRVSDIIAATSQFEKGNKEWLLSASLSQHSPYYTILEEASDGFVLIKESTNNFTRRQDIPKTYDINGAIYIWKNNFLASLKKELNNKYYKQADIFIMPPQYSIDIDTEMDFKIAKFLMSENANRSQYR